MTDEAASVVAARARRRYPVLTVALAAAALGLALVVFFGNLLLPDLFDGQPWSGTAFWLGPPALLILAAVSAPFHRSVSVNSRGGWAAVSVCCAVLWMPTLWFVGVLIFGP